jgi:hypothetical protein
LARIEPGTYDRITTSLFIEGDTAITGKVERVGGATDIRCGLRVPFQSRMLFCGVAGTDVARKLGDKLYQIVAVRGTARWLKNSWRIVSFTIRDVYQPVSGSLPEAMDSLREAGGKGWDNIDDPEAYLQEVSAQ